MIPHGDGTPSSGALLGHRQVYYEPVRSGEVGAFADAPVWARDGLLAGNVLAGPAVVEEVSATTILYPGDRAVVHESGSLLVELSA